MHAWRGSQYPSSDLKASHLALACCLPHPLHLFYHTAWNTQCLLLLFLLQEMLSPQTLPWLLSPFLQNSAQKGLPWYLMKKLPSSLLPHSLATLFWVLNLTGVASVFTVSLSLWGWKPHEGRNLVSRTHPISSRQKLQNYLLDERREGGKEGKEFRDCLVQYVRKTDKIPFYALLTIFWWFFWHFHLFLKFGFLYFYLEISQLLKNMEELLNFIS